MKNFKNYKNQAFSLIELSIVILIIGILVAGVTQSSRLIRQMQLSSARALTLSSPVLSIPNLVSWYEPTQEKSFDEVETSENSLVSKWYDLSLVNSDPVSVSSKTIGASWNTKHEYKIKALSPLESILDTRIKSKNIMAKLADGKRNSDLD